MIIHLTSNCSLNCSHCYLEREKGIKELTVNDLKWISETFDIHKVMLMGGEPLLYPHLKDAFGLFKNITISTNGLALTEANGKDWINLFKKKERDNFSVQLSIEGLEKDTNEIRGEGIWQKVMNGINLLLKNDIHCFLRMGYHIDNIKSIPKIIKDICIPSDVPLVLVPRIDLSPLDSGNQAWLFNLIVESNNEYLDKVSRELYGKTFNSLTISEKEQFRHQLKKLGKNAVCLLAQPHFIQWLGEEAKCEAGSERLNITYNREITPCHFDWHHIFGYIGDELSFITENRLEFLNKYKRIHPSCSFCGHASTCKSSCYVAQSHFGCPLKQNFTIDSCIAVNKIDTSSIQTQITGINNLIEGSLVC